MNVDDLVKSPFSPLFVIPAKAGIQLIQIVLDSCFRRSDGFRDFLRDHQRCLFVDYLFHPPLSYGQKIILPVNYPLCGPLAQKHSEAPGAAIKVRNERSRAC